ncbi:hypothetical protein ARMSODRAFT_1017270 [Armillaria solidipes]|uniref:Uncharacterized protein n=1 Tax=Armillaria solidipes TaxID=1076256 RepID=A0A2H3C7V6_9AGAR|nr:hypothetical protein ARMSODRAFT_1017270 [Armillaria solidipes]
MKLVKDPQTLYSLTANALTVRASVSYPPSIWHSVWITDITMSATSIYALDEAAHQPLKLRSSATNLVRMSIPYVVTQNERTSVTPWNAPTSSTLQLGQESRTYDLWLGDGLGFDRSAMSTHSSLRIYLVVVRDDTGTEKLQQQIHHYGSGSNALPSISEFATPPTD